MWKKNLEKSYEVTENLGLNISTQTLEEVHYKDLLKVTKIDTTLSRPFNGNRKLNEQIHLMNYCRLKNSTFTCAIDSFLEI